MKNDFNQFIEAQKRLAQDQAEQDQTRDPLFVLRHLPDWCLPMSPDDYIARGRELKTQNCEINPEI